MQPDPYVSPILQSLQVEVGRLKKENEEIEILKEQIETLKDQIEGIVKVFFRLLYFLLGEP